MDADSYLGTDRIKAEKNRAMVAKQESVEKYRQSGEGEGSLPFARLPRELTKYFSLNDINFVNGGK